ncbi:SH2B adapter protein 2 [Copidosoma floridanum]|uniref:SH2B adapter protein 2 n=1 Tax=Copidosoma floridanum TaxID=29053 RepID=UPI0006C999E5|nr:SH2B adapter protein 2 [Copidosoma floridanum]
MSNGAAAASSPTGTAAAGNSEDWAEFCDRQARYAAQEFARAFCTYVNVELTEIARTNLSYKDFLRKFFERFCDHFEVEYSKRSVRSPSSQNLRLTASNNRISNAISQNNRISVRASSNEEFGNHLQQNGEKTSPKPTHKPFFRRLSFKGLKKSKAFFLKQQSDDTERAHVENRKVDKHSKTKLSKIVVECRKEGYVNAMVVENADNAENTNISLNNTDNTDGSQQFEKCRLSLVRASAGYMLEFFYSSKSKPRYGIFCSGISETRETTALEMPDKENTFVLKTGEKEFIIEAKDPVDMKSWLATIKYCIRDPQGLQCESSGSDLIDDGSLMHGLVSMHVDEDRTRANSASKSIRSNTDHLDEHGSNPPELPPRLKARSSSNLELCSSQQEIEQIAGNEVESFVDLSSSLREYPWFHGTLPRTDATMLVLHNGTDGHGTFLVRQSETRKGEYVLTFNFQGKAKHLRMTLNDQGCRVQHLSFSTIHDMLEHFRQHPIPLETGGTADVKLTEYVVANLVVHGQPVLPTTTLNSSSQSSDATMQQERRVVPLPEPREVQTFAGSIRLRTESLERIEQQQLQVQQQQLQHQSNITGEQQATANRAVQNAYSFL